MEGISVRRLNGRDTGKDLNLLTKQGDTEIMVHRVAKDAVAWLTPAENPAGFEFYFVLSGCGELSDGSSAKEYLSAGDCFTVHGLKDNILMKALEESTLLCVTNTPSFDQMDVWNETLMEQLRRIDDVDHYTQIHSRAVMYYAVKLFEALWEPMGLTMSLEDYVIGVLFHDIGKCEVPKEILCKPARLTREEYDIIKKHPVDSWKRLQPLYGDSIAGLARMHHERLDGSGYPDGLSADRIPPEVRILSVADAFDAMTRKRVYSNAKGMAEAAEELYSMSDQYDRRVTEKLLQIVRDGSLDHYIRELDEKDADNDVGTGKKPENSNTENDKIYK